MPILQNMKIQENISLKPYNTFGMDSRARYFIHAQGMDEVEQAVLWAKEKEMPLLVLSGGSNMLVTEDLDAVVLHMDTAGIEIVGKDGSDTLVRVAAGENWHGFVQWAVGQNLAGIENLAFIPGRVGSSPVQNIGAYGAEAKDAIESVEALDVRTLERRVIPAAECRFGYRESIFKREYRGRYVILSVTFRLHDPAKHTLKLDYGNIRRELESRGIANPTLADVASVVTDIRKAKLPDPAKIGNSGSFFKNPVVSKAVFERLSGEYPGIPSFDPENASDGHYKKIPAAWMIERAGWKGYRRGDAGVHRDQALVLVNYGQATGDEILRLCGDICADVAQKFGVEISPEVNVIDNKTIEDLRP